MEEKESGEFIGAFSPYGYIKNPRDNHKLIVDKESAEIVKKIFDWKVNEGLGNLSICYRLNDMGILNPTGYKKKKLNQNYNNAKVVKEDYSWCPSTVRNILKNDVYIGNITQGKRKVKSYKIHKVEQVPEKEWITVENMHEAIIDKKIFEKAQKLRKVDTRIQKSGKISCWSGILKCADCGRAMHKKYCKNKSGKIYEYYVCGTYRKKSNKLCTKHTIKAEELENAVLHAINLHIKVLLNVKDMIKQIEEFRRERVIDENIERAKEKKKNELNKVRNLKKGLYEDWKDGYITKGEYLEYRERYKKDIKKLENTINNLNRQKESEEEKIKENNKWIEKFKLQKRIKQLDRNIIVELIECIEVHEEKKIDIHFKFKNELI